MITVGGKYTNAKIMIDDIEPQCYSQILSFVNHPAFTNNIAIMPDTHAGKGSVIGFTMPLNPYRIIPNVVGVDISCGIVGMCFGFDANFNLDDSGKYAFDTKIRELIPFGQTVHTKSVIHFKNDFPWKELNQNAIEFIKNFYNKFKIRIEPPNYDYDWFENKCKQIGVKVKYAIDSIGTLGGGNHFIEIGKSEKTGYWITIHSGSRNFGARICQYWQGIAEKKIKNIKINELQKEILDIKSKYSGIDINIEINKAKERLGLNDKVSGDLLFLENEDAISYLIDMLFTQMYAEVNRNYMSYILCNIINSRPIKTIKTNHNFIDFEDFIIRKGAIKSYINEEMIIPFNMEDGILICTGKSNPEWNYSAPHGAGRLFSRSDAKKKLSLEDAKTSMENSGIFTTGIPLDEVKGAYKDSDVIKQAIEPTAVIIDKINPIHNLKAL